MITNDYVKLKKLMTNLRWMNSNFLIHFEYSASKMQHDLIPVKSKITAGMLN